MKLKEVINSFIELGDKVIEQEEEIERLNKALDTATEIINNKTKEIVKLNNIINEFEEWLNAKYEEMHDIWYVKVLNKLNELKGSDKE